MAVIAVIVGVLVALYAAQSANNWLFGRAHERITARNAERDRRQRQGQ